MSVADLLAKAIAAKEAGNAAFKEGEMKKASFQYKLVNMSVGSLGTHAAAAGQRMADILGGASADGMAKALVDGKKGPKATPEEQQAIDQVIAAAYCNMALAHVNLQRFPQAVAAADVTLLYEPENVKAMYRRGLAFLSMGRTDEAKDAFAAVLERAPGDAMAQQRLEETLAAAKQQEAKQRAAMKGMFAS